MGFRKTRTIRTPAAGTWSKGKFTEGNYTNSTIMASLQPATPTDMRRLPEGRRERKTFFIITETELQHITVGGENPTQILYKNEWFEFSTMEDWQNDVINHYAYLVTKVQEADDDRI